MRKIRKRVFAAVLAAALLFTMPGMASYAEAETAQTEDISESVTVLAEYDTAEETEAENEVIQEPGTGDSDTDKLETGEDDAGDVDAQEPVEKETVPTPKEDAKECTCGTLCTQDSINGDCPVCGVEDAELSCCEGEKTENRSEENKEDAEQGDTGAQDAGTNLCAHHKEHTKDCGYIPASEDREGSQRLGLCTYECHICLIEDLIAALPDEVTEGNAEKVRVQLDKILALYRELTAEEQEQIDLTRCYDLQAALDEANAPVTVAVGDVVLSESIMSVTFTVGECGDNCQGHIITQGPAMMTGYTYIIVESGTHNVTFSGLNISPNAKVGVMPGATMNLTLQGTNTIKGNDSGIYVPEGATLFIGGSGSLTVSASGAAAGIGGAYFDPSDPYGDQMGNFNCGTVVINGGSITATGGSACAGIGGACGDYDHTTPGNGGNVTINGGTVTATGGGDSDYYGGAGIGGGIYNRKSGSGGTLTIYGGHVTLNVGTLNDQYGVAYGFGRGSGSNSNAGTLTLADADCLTLTSGTTLDPNGTYFINDDPTPDMIVVPENLVYTGNPLDVSGIKIDDSKTGTATHFGQTFNVTASAEGWVLQDLGEVKEAGEYTVTFTKGGKSISTTFTVAECPHTGLVYEPQADNKHGGACPDCGTEVSEEHTWEDGVCSVCNFKAVAKVEIGNDTTYYGTIESAWTAANGKTATITLLASAEISNPLMLSGGNITVIGRGHRITSEDYVFGVGGGKLAIESGTFSGGTAAIVTVGSANVDTCLKNYGDNSVSEHYAYFDENGAPIDVNKLTDPTQSPPTVTVRVCTHPEVIKDQGNGTHGGNCPYCGTEFAAAAHTLGDGNVCTGCNAELKVQVEIGNATTYYGTIGAAWTAVEGKTATITLLDKVTSMLLPVSNDDKITLNGGGHTLSIIGFDVGGGQLAITSGTFEMEASLHVSGGTVHLSGGTFRIGSGGAIYCSSGVASLLLNYGSTNISDKHYAYFDEAGKPIALEEGQTTLTGTVTVQECNHDANVCKYQPLDGGTSHIKTCLACGMTWEAEPHTLGADNKCAQCEAELVVQVNDACYSDIKAAWGAACTADAATLTLLRDVETGDMLYVNSGNITFDGGNYTLKGTNPALTVNVSGGTLTVVSGTISGGHTCVNITDGVLVVKGGKIETSDYEGINVAGGTAIISGGEIRGSSVGVTRGRNAELIISGGTFYCLSNGSTVNVIGGKVGEVLLNYGDANAETHYAFYRDDKPYKLPDGGTLPGGTFTVQQCKEPLAYTHASGTTKHTQSCQYCGAGNSETDCSFTWTDDTGECVCGAVLVVNVSEDELTYDGTAKEPEVTVTLDGTELTAGYTVTCSNNINAGNNTASVTVSDTNWKYTQKFAIQKAPLTITASDQTITYGGSITQGAGNVTVAGLCTGDVLESITLTASTANVPGGNITPSAAGIKNSGGDVTGNYEITYKDGRLTINKADAEITVGTNTYNNTFGDAAFTLDVTDNNTETDVQYEVTAGADVVSVSNGTVTVRNAGTATITVSLPETANYNAAASKTITVTVAQKGGYTVTEQNRSYLYSRVNTGSIDLAALLPKDCGTVTYGTPAASGDVTYSAAPAVDNGILSYTLNSGEINAEGTITVTVSTRNYTDITVTVKVKLTDQMPVSLKTGTEVTLENNVLTYGEPLSKLKFNKAEFVDDDGKTVLGTLAWKDAAATPNAGTTGATWVFTPNNETYAPVEGTAAITVNRAVPEVSAAPTVAGRVYGPSAALQDSDLEGGTVNVPGTWGWQKAGIIPAVNNSGYDAVFTPEDTTNYETVPWTITVNVTKATPYIAGLPAAAAITYGEALKDSLLSGGTVQYGSGTGQAGEGAGSTEPVAGAFTWKEPSTKPVAADSNVTEYTIVFTPSDTADYNPVEAKVRLTVNKAQNAPNMPGSAMSVSNSIEKVGSVPLPAGWEWQASDKDTALEVGVAVSAVAVYTGADKGNYENETVTVAITRADCSHENTELRDVVAATCQKKGYSGDTYCLDCGEILEKGTEINPTDHSGGTATCISGRVCQVCGTEYTEKNSGNHTHTEIRGAAEPACTADGYTGDTYCTDCNTKTGTGTVIPATGHTEDDGSVTKAPTETEKGIRTYKCSVCGYVMRTEEIEELPPSHTHSYGTDWKSDSSSHWHECACGDRSGVSAHTEDDGSVTKAPTETEKGIRTYKCSVCGYVMRTEEIEELPPSHTHSYGTDWKSDSSSHWHECACGDRSGVSAHTEDGGSVTKAPTETEKGIRTYKCSVCGYVMRTEEIEELPPSHTHSYGTDWKSDSNSHWHECACGDRSGVSAHTEDGGSVTKAPTETEKGIRTYRCSVCGYVMRTEEIEELPPSHTHSYGTDWKSDSNSHWHECACGDRAGVSAHTEDGGNVTKAPTETEKGVRTYKCSVCGYVMRTEEIEKLPPSPGNGDDNSGSGSGDNSGQGSGTGTPTQGTKQPFIKGEDGKAGWDVIRAEEEQAQEGSIINVDMNGSTVVPENIFGSIRGRSITVTFDMGSGILWSVDGRNITADRTGDIDFSVRTGTDAVPADVISNVAGGNWQMQLNLAYEGEFGFTAVLSLNLGRENAGRTARLYYYNENAGELELVSTDEVAGDGTAELAITHASDYVIVVDAGTEGEDVPSGSGIETPGQDAQAQSPQPQDAQAQSPQTGQPWRPLWVVVIGMLAIIIGAGVFFVRKKGKEDADGGRLE